MYDLISHLRARGPLFTLRNEAADEIERLRGEIESWKELVASYERRLKK